MANNISTIDIQASKQKVWAVITTATFIKRWQYGSDLITTWEVGTDIKFRTEWDGNIFEQWGKVLEFQPNELLRYSLFAATAGLQDKLENYFIMSYILREENGRTILEIIQDDNRPNAIQEKPQGAENPVLSLLKELAEMDN